MSDHHQSSSPANVTFDQSDLLNEFDCFLNVDDAKRKQLIENVQARIQRSNGEFLLQIPSFDQDQTWTKEQWSEIDLNLRQVCESATVDCICFNSNLSEEEPNDYEDTKAEDVAKRRVLIRRKLKPDDFLEVRVAVLGNVDAGKSTLLGVLTHGHLDDGRGSARQHLLRHLHEQQTGRTSSVGCNILGFDSSGRIVNESCVHGTRLHWQEVCMRAGKVLSLLDLAGHERYLKTTIFGLTGLAPHCSMLMVGGNAGLIGMGREHLGLCLALSLPVFVVVSKVDSAPANVLQQTLATLQRLLRSSSCRRTPLLVRDINDVWLAADAIAHRRPLCPVFQLSSVTGHNMRFIKQFLSLLSPNTAANVVATTETPSRPPITLNSPEFYIEETFSVPGVGTVVSGLCASGRIEPNDTLMLGPDRTGKFNPVQIKSIHRKRLPVTEVHGGHSAALALKKVKKSDLRKGMVLVSSNLNPKACWEFVAEIIILHHPTTISKNYQAMVHTGNVRQTATIHGMSKEYLRTGDRAKVHLRFVVHPEFIKPGQRLVFREGRTKAIGNIVQVVQGNAPHFKFGTRKILASDADESELVKKESTDSNDIEIQTLSINKQQRP